MGAKRYNNDSVAALVAIHQAERTDSTSKMNFSLGLVAAEAAYLVGTLALWDKFTLLKRWVAFLPFPLICLVSFQSVLLAASATKVVSVAHLEKRLMRFGVFTIALRPQLRSEVQPEFTRRAQSFQEGRLVVGNCVDGALP